jgi:hypothetical protein
LEDDRLYCEDVLLPEVEALKAGTDRVLGLPDGVAFDIVIEGDESK